jgi:hypothetical protein
MFSELYDIIISICHIRKKDIEDLEEPLLSKCENETTNMILDANKKQLTYRIDPNLYYAPPFCLLNTVYEDA